MSIKDKIGKMKSFLFDDEEEDSKKISIKKPIKEHKEEKKEIDIEDEKFSKTKEIESLYFEDISEPEIEIEKPKEEVIKSRVERKEIEFDFPDFNDNDFMKPEPEKKPDPVVSYAREDVKPILYQGSKRGTESKRFKPTPMISPVYGLLDEDGMTISHDTAKKQRQKEEASIDDVRKKAFGSYDEGIKMKTIEEAEKDMEEEEKNGEIEEPKVSIKETVKVNADEDDDMILPNINFKEIDITQEMAEEEPTVESEENEFDEHLNDEKKDEEKSKKSHEDDDDDEDEETKEQDLFNLIDSMYQKEGEEE